MGAGWPLDRGEPWRYQQRLTMLGFGRHNWSASTPTTSSMPSPFQRVEPHEAHFPAALRNLTDPVAELWYQGRLPSGGERTIAMVGSRAASRSRCDLAAAMAAELARSGRAVISGGALGVDAAAHRGALDGGGATFAVLGCGVDVVYPDRHGPLFTDIAVRGGLLSEYQPGWPPRPFQFPVRNRIVAALAEAVVVVEARAASGALITARLGRELGRPVYAVPGSPGTDALIARGASPVEDPSDLVGQLGGAPPAARPVPEALVALVDVLLKGPMPPAELARRLGITLADALGQLGEAELGGWVRRAPGGRFEVPRVS
jgi:DNA processing protein